MFPDGHPQVQRDLERRDKQRKRKMSDVSWNMRTKFLGKNRSLFKFFWSSQQTQLKDFKGAGILSFNLSVLGHFLRPSSSDGKKPKPRWPMVHWALMKMQKAGLGVFYQIISNPKILPIITLLRWILPRSHRLWMLGLLLMSLQTNDSSMQLGMKLIC